ncbi:MAG TPA: FAD-dependent oxidoreductase [Tepidisphaeraceae bacterium]|jgi:hypothetical protein
MSRELKTQILIVGASTGGTAAAIAAASLGARVILTEPTIWIGGQLTSQAVPPDEHPWIEEFGCTRRYRALREGIRQRFRDTSNLTDAAKKDPRINPGGGVVSKLCHDPRLSLHVLNQMLQPFIASGQVQVLLRHEPLSADVEQDRVRSVTIQNIDTHEQISIAADYFLDATELGDLLPLAKCEYVSGAESKKQTGEPHGPDDANPDNVQGFTWCMPVALDPAPGAKHVIEKPRQYEQWRTYVPHLTPPWPGRLISYTYSQPISLKPISRHILSKDPKQVTLWRYRQIVRDDIYKENPPHPVTLVNWPQNDYWEHNVIDKPREDVAVYVEEARQLSLSLLYWMQTEAPRHDEKGEGYPNLHLIPEIVGSKDGLALAPYFRESRRIKALFTVTENHVGSTARFGSEVPINKLKPGQTAEIFSDTVGIGYYRIDLHPSTAGKNYIDIASLPFQIPLGALIPQRLTNLLPACKNLGTTHITNGCYRLHPVEWNIGESAGLLAAHCLNKKCGPHEIHADKTKLADFQSLLAQQGVELAWPDKVYPKT